MTSCKEATLQMKGWWKSYKNVGFSFLYSQKWNCYFQNRIIMFCPSSYTHISGRDIFPGSVCLFCCREICGPILWEHINRSQTHECGNWDWGHAIPIKGINKWDFASSALVMQHRQEAMCPFPSPSLSSLLWQVEFLFVFLSSGAVWATASSHPVLP